MYDFISSEGGRLLVEWETEGGRKARAIAHLASGPADVEGRKVITIDRVVRPDGVPVAAWEGKSFSIPLEKIRTLGYVADDEETEAITAAKFQFRFLSPTFRSAFKYNEKEYPSLEAALIDAATNPEAIKKGYVEEGVIPGPAFLRAGWFTPGVKPPQPSDETLNTVLNIVNARFADPVVRRMLVSTGDRRFELPADEGGSFLGVDLNDIYTRVRRGRQRSPAHGQVAQPIRGPDRARRGEVRVSRGEGVPQGEPGGVRGTGEEVLSPARVSI
jgi:hypothetical protein